MYLAIEFMDAGSGLRLIAKGQVPGALLVEAHRLIAERHLDAFCQARYWFSNHSALDAALLEHSHARKVATLSSRLAASHPHLIIGSLVPGDLEFGMTRTWQALAEQTGWQVGIHRDEQGLQRFFEQAVGRPIDLHGPADGPPVVAFGAATVAKS